MAWTLNDIPWDQFDPTKVDAETVKVVKAASLVEHNGEDYATYLCNVFADDPVFQDATRAWAREEVQHGQALRRWAELADPAFDFETAFQRFTEGFRLPLDADESVRGSRAGELIARCIVETGTSSWYTAIKDGTEEPVLRAICRHIAADELRHYKLFYANLQRYLEAERLTGWGRLRVAAGRVAESEDDELAYAYYAANGATGVYDRRTCIRAYARRAYPYYRPHHVERGMAMIFKAVGLDPQSRLHRLAASLAWRFIDYRTKALTKHAA
ncbi:MAG TPA: ferritin-like domain-containing protein [Candidatus Sulfotelmatobacter sp.]|nr:ferritin-like domain-containing protein [Candidatus Sulfotelmatobacter sp.]